MSLADELLLINTQLANKGIGSAAQPMLTQTPRGRVINNAQGLQAAWNAYHPKQTKQNTKLHDALIKIHNDQTSSQFKTNMDLFKPRPHEPTPKAPPMPDQTTPFQPTGLPGPFGKTPGTPKTVGAAAPASAPPSQADITRYTDATRMNQVQAFNEAARANDLTKNPQASGHDVFDQVVQAEGLTPQDAQNVYRAMMRESNGNNEWQAGSTHDVNSGVDPAFGPLQIIQKTFDAYAEPGWNRMNAFDSMRAAIRYAKSRYGSGWSQRMAASGY